MERWRARYSLLGGSVLVPTGGLVVTADVGPVPAGLGFAVGLALLFLTVRPTAYVHVITGVGALTAASGGYLLLTDAPGFGGLLAVVGLAAAHHGVQIRRVAETSSQ